MEGKASKDGYHGYGHDGSGFTCDHCGHNFSTSQALHKHVVSQTAKCMAMRMKSLLACEKVHHYAKAKRSISDKSDDSLDDHEVFVNPTRAPKPSNRKYSRTVVSTLERSHSGGNHNLIPIPEPSADLSLFAVLYSESAEGSGIGMRL